MTDLVALLDSSIDAVKIGLAGKTLDELLQLETAERNGKTRKGVLDALAAAITEADVTRRGNPAIAADLDNSGLANIPAADAIDTSGAPQQIVPDVDLDHPAVDNDPRANTTVEMNQIDFNDPTREGVDVVTEQLQAGASE